MRQPKMSSASFHQGSCEDVPNLIQGRDSVLAAAAVIADVNAFIRRGPDDTIAVRSLGRLVVVFPWVSRLPQLGEYLTWLESKRRHMVVARIVNDPSRRGRRHKDQLELVRLVLESKERGGYSKAYRAVASQLGMTPKAVDRTFHERREEHERRRAGQSLRAGLLTETSWTEQSKKGR